MWRRHYLGASKEQMDSKIEIYAKNKVGKSFRQRKMLTKIVGKCWSKMFHSYQRRSMVAIKGHLLMCQVNVDVSGQTNDVSRDMVM
jgi:hypothetical protein